MINMSSLIHAKDEQEFEDRFQKLVNNSGLKSEACNSACQKW